MKTNVWIMVVMFITTIVQFSVPIGGEYYIGTYFVYLVVIVARILFVLKLFAIPVPLNLIYGLEAAPLALSCLIFFMNIYGQNTFILWPGFLVVIFISIAYFIMYTIEDTVYVYTVKEHKDAE